MIHNNSYNAYTEEQPKLNKRAVSILEYMRDVRASLTDRQIQTGMGYAERNMVQPRISELIKMGCLFEVGKVKCSLTNKSVRLVSAKPGLYNA